MKSNRSKPVRLDLAKVREGVSDIVQELGMLLEHFTSATDPSAKNWPAQMAEYLSNACDAARDANEYAFKLERYIEDRAVAANRRFSALRARATKKQSAKSAKSAVKKSGGRR